jgi:hypothetical protein
MASAGKVLRGPNDVREALKLRPAGATTRHLITNVVIDVTNSTRAEATFYLGVFFHASDVPPKLPVPIELPRHISIFNASFARGASGWSVAELSEIPTFAK